MTAEIEIVVATAVPGPGYRADLRWRDRLVLLTRLGVEVADDG